MDPRFRSLKFLEKIDGSCSKLDVRKAISSMALQMEIGHSGSNYTDDNQAAKAATAAASGGTHSRRHGQNRHRDNEKAMSDLFGDNEPNEDINSDTPEDIVAKEITQYFGEKDTDRDVNILHWWSVNAHRFKLLARLARQYVVVTATSSPCERLFSEAGAIADRKRATLSPEHVDILTCLHHNLSSIGMNTVKTDDMDLSD